MQKIQVLLEIDELSALGQLAYLERRDTDAQAAWLIRHELVQRGLLPDQRITENQTEAANQGATNAPY